MEGPTALDTPIHLDCTPDPMADWAGNPVQPARVAGSDAFARSGCGP
jgi:hypothetical protein